MKRAIVSGITGHLGQELARQLVSAGVEVSGLTRQDVTEDQRRNEAVRLHRVDGRTETLVAIFDAVQPDTVFHLAGLYRREHQSADVSGLVATNILFATQLLEAMRLVECRRFITAGSYFQHFDTDEYRALNLYAATKQAFEALLSYYVDACGISAVRLTLSDIYSEHDNRRKVLTDIATAWAGGMPLYFRDEEIWIDPVHVEDVAAAFLQTAALLESNVLSKSALSRYSVSYGRDVTSAELVSLFERLGGRKMTVSRGQGWRSSRRMKPWRGEIVPGWEPRVTIEDGIKRILEMRRGG